jgi:hypothetical protein
MEDKENVSPGMVSPSTSPARARGAKVTDSILRLARLSAQSLRPAGRIAPFSLF